MAETKGTKQATQHENKPGTQREPQARSTQAGESARRTSLAQRRGSIAPSQWRESPFMLMNRFAEEMEQLFEDFGFGRSWRAPLSGLGSRAGSLADVERSLWSPESEVFEREGHLVVRTDLPGLSKDDVKIDITDNVLTVSGERKHEHEDCDESFCRSERSFGRFSRSIALPEGVDADKATANLRDGVLEITIPAPQRAQRGRAIEIKDESQREREPRAGAQTSGK
jgi:HSP20 family protein